jgi:phosphate transport system protein
VRRDKEVTMAIAVSDHTTKAFDVDLQDLNRMVAEMGGYAEKQFAEAIDALTRRDGKFGEKVVQADAQLDAQQRDIELKAIATIATRQPMAVDLRDIIGILRIANELERIGDLAKNIAKRVAAMNGEAIPRRAFGGVTHITSLALHQLTDVLDSFVARDSKLAMTVWQRDEEIDSMYTSLFRELLTYMMEDPGTIAFGIHLLFCAKNIERMGDHMTNIAEAVYYMVEGHSFMSERPKADTTSLMNISFNGGH